MSLQMTDVDGRSVEVQFIGLSHSGTNGVRIGEIELPLDDFCAMAAHFLTGGFFGWGNDETPEAVNKALSYLFELYEQVDGKWIRKAKYGLSLPEER